LSRSLRRGFSLLEVMVAIAILGLSLTVILSAQGGLAASNRSASNMGQAVALARCKMTELEERMLKMGYPELDAIDTDVACCNDDKNDVFVCDTRIEKVVLPNASGGNALGDGGLLSMMGSGAGPGANGPINNPAGAGGALNLSLDGGLAGLGAQVGAQLGAGSVGGAGAQGLLSMVMGLVYPSMKPMFEASIRRLTVTVRWKEAGQARELPVVQYITNPQRGGFSEFGGGPDGGAGTIPGVPGLPGSSVPAGPAGRLP